jgi:hypothetical protein
MEEAVERSEAEGRAQFEPRANSVGQVEPLTALTALELLSSSRTGPWGR